MPRNKCRRGVEVNDLLNFEFPFHGKNSLRLPARHRSTPHRSIDATDWKRLFILQNFQFIVRQDVWTNFLEQGGICQGKRRLIESLCCGDILAPWEAIHSVLMRAPPEQFECRICFDYPVAPRVTECGHLFCLPCILHYLQYQKLYDRPKICPVCQNIVVLSLLKPCVLQPLSTVTTGREVRFDLYTRNLNSVQLVPHDSAVEPLEPSDVHSSQKEIRLPLYMSPDALHSRYVLSTREHEENQQHLDLEGLMERQKSTMDMVRPLTQYDDMVVRSIEDAIREVMSATHDYSLSFKRASPPLAPRPAVTEENKKVYDIYAEGENGQPFYVHRLSMKMLMHDARVRGCPLQKSVKAKVVEIVTLTQTEKLRSTHKVFSHIPLYGKINLCILDLSSIVSQKTIEAFKDDLQSQEERRGAHAQESELASLARSETTSRHNPAMKHTSDAAASRDSEPWADACCDFDSLMYCPLPSTSSASSLTNVQSSTQRESDTTAQNCQNSTRSAQGSEVTSNATVKHPIAGKGGANCWSTGNVCRLLTKTPSKQGPTPTWGGHAFRPH